LKIADIEIRRVTLEYDESRAYELMHYHDLTQRTIYIVHTEDGLVGLGEGERPESQEVIDQYLGTNPFDWMGDETSLGLGTAMYDLMGKASGVPVYKLFGQKYRSWIPVAAWTVSTHPDRMAKAVQDYAEQGHTKMKFHLSPFENVFDQTQAMQNVAPKGFRIHYDFTMHGTEDYMPGLLERLSEYEIAGFFEDPLPGEDIDGYVELRQRSKLPIVLHHFPTAATFEIFRRPADAYMLGHSKIGDAVRRAGLFAADNSPFMLQNSGSDITRAMTTHMMAAFPSATFHFVSATEVSRERFVTKPLHPINGFIRVPEQAGLGVELDMKEVKRLERVQPRSKPKFIIVTSFDNGATLYTCPDPKNPHFMVRPDWSRTLMPMSFAAPLTSEYWDDDDSDQFDRMMVRIEKEGAVLEDCV
tara:strand:- start:104 stop:1348 length:1245 start_codon:yes stop_codon:yes gene_type:complete